MFAIKFGWHAIPPLPPSNLQTQDRSHFHCECNLASISVNREFYMEQMFTFLVEHLHNASTFETVCSSEGEPEKGSASFNCRTATQKKTNGAFYIWTRTESTTCERNRPGRTRRRTRSNNRRARDGLMQERSNNPTKLL